MRRLILLICGIMLAGCATPPPVDATATVVPLSEIKSDGTAGTAHIHVAIPCHTANFLMPAMLQSSNLNVLLDGKAVAQIGPCQYRRIPVPAGKHAIRVGDRMLDFGGLFGNGQEFALPAGGTAYFGGYWEMHGNATVYYVKEINEQESAQLVATIDQATKQKS
jgi:hypothetical protein